MSLSPCKDCEDRSVSPNCHTNCTAYKRWCSERQKARSREKEFLIQFHDVAAENHAEFGRRRI